MDTSLLLSREEFAQASKKRGPSPFTLEIEKANQVLFYFGANHSRDPNDSQYPKIQEYWERFLQATQGRERIALVEGGLRKLSETGEQAIRRDSEAGLVTFLAHQAGIPVACPDIRDHELIKLLPDALKDLAPLYWFLAFADTWRREADPKPGFEKYVASWMQNQKGRGMWHGIDTSFETMKNLYQEVIGKELHAKDDFNALINPNKTETMVNKVARAQSDLRDAHIVSEIERYWKEGKSIFVAFGSGHLIIEEPALKKLLK